MFDPRHRSWIRAMLTAILATILLALGAGPSQAADGARIQEVETKDGHVTFLLSAVGLAPGESLDTKSVQVSINGVAVPATTDAADTTSVQRTVYLVMDTSGSMKGSRLDAAKAAGQQYLTSVPADVSVGLITFADDAVVAVPATTDRNSVSAALNAAQAGGSTALFDAALLAVQRLGDSGSRSIVMLSDGEDQGSTATEQQALGAVTESGVAFDAVALTAGTGADQLARLAAAGGGTVVQAADAKTLTAAFESAALTAASQVMVTADLPPGQTPGTVPLAASVVVAGSTLTDQAVVVIDAATVAAAAASAADSAGPVPVEARSAGFMQRAWFLPTLMIALFGALALITLLALRLASEEGLQPRRVKRRIESYGVASAGNAQGAASGDNDPGVIAQRAVAMAEQVVNKRDPDKVLERRLESAGVPMRPAEWAVLHACIVFTAAGLAAALSGFSILWTLIGLAVGLLVPWAILGRKSSKRRQEFYEALPEVLDLLAGSVASGYSFLQAVDAISTQSQGVAATEFHRASSEAMLGVPIEDALTDVANRMDSRDFLWVVMAVSINRRVGGNLADVLRTVSKTLRERERVRRQVKALTAEGRLSAIILGSLPFVMAAYMLLVRPEYIGLLFSNVIGWAMTLVAIVLLIVGVLWMRKQIQLEV